MNELTIPRSHTLVTGDVIDSWEAWYRDMAEHTLEDEGAVFERDEEKEYEVCRRMLEFCGAGTAVNDAVRQRVLTQIARYRLYHFSPEGWSSLADVVRDTMEGLTSSGVSEWTTVLETVIPFAEKHDLEIYEDPTKAGYLREAASGLAAIIASPGVPEQRVAARVEEELQFIFEEANSRREVRDRFRKYRGVPGTGTVAHLDNKETMLMIIAPPATTEAIKQRLGRLVSEWRPCRASLIHGPLGASKIVGQQVQTDILTVEHEILRVFDAETGELIREVTK